MAQKAVGGDQVIDFGVVQNPLQLWCLIECAQGQGDCPDTANRQYQHDVLGGWRQQQADARALANPGREQGAGHRRRLLVELVVGHFAAVADHRFGVAIFFGEGVTQPGDCRCIVWLAQEHDLSRLLWRIDLNRPGFAGGSNS